MNLLLVEWGKKLFEGQNIAWIVSIDLTVTVFWLERDWEIKGTRRDRKAGLEEEDSITVHVGGEWEPPRWSQNYTAFKLEAL